MAVKVQLEANEMFHAAMLGVQRHVECTRQRISGKYGAPENDWNLDIEGSAGELAVAKALNRHWSMPLNTFRRGGDVGDLQVRTSRQHFSRLIVRHADRDEDLFILVTGTAPIFYVHGYIQAAQAKQRRWLQAPGGRPAAFFVPRSALKPLSDLHTAPEQSHANAHLDRRAG